MRRKRDARVEALLSRHPVPACMKEHLLGKKLELVEKTLWCYLSASEKGKKEITSFFEHGGPDLIHDILKKRELN